MSLVRRFHFTEKIATPVETVYRTMIDLDGFKEWTSAFTEGSYFEGSWQQGKRIRFMAPSGEGTVSDIAVNKPNERISIRHIGFIANGVEDTTSEAIREKVPAYEIYTFKPTETGAELIVEIDVTPDSEAYTIEKWPKALNRLKAICEAQRGS